MIWDERGMLKEQHRQLAVFVGEKSRDGKRGKEGG